MAQKYLARIIRFHETHRRLPSYAEILALTGLRSKNAVHKLVQKLIASGFLARDTAGKIVPGKLFGEVRLLGTVEAGFPSPAEEELIDTLSLDDYLIRNKEATYLLKASGTSMIDAGILPGDMVLVERGQEPRSGDIVIAEVDGKWTMKYFRKIGGKVRLDPANKKFPPIFPQEELKIAAIVKAVIRKYQ